MCKERDIIVINHYKSQGSEISKHSFVVLSTESGKIQGLPYDIICNVLSSIKDESQRIRKMKYRGNFPITNKDTLVVQGNKRDGYIKADQLYFFNKDLIDYKVIGEITVEIYEKLLEHIKNLKQFEYIIDNL